MDLNQGSTANQSTQDDVNVSLGSSDDQAKQEIITSAPVPEGNQIDMKKIDVTSASQPAKEDANITAADSGADTQVDLNIQRFAENLLQEKDLENIDQKTRDIMREELVDRLEKVTNRVLVDNLPEDKLDEFESMIDKSAKPAELQKFISDNVPDIENKLIDAYFDFRRLYLGL